VKVVRQKPWVKTPQPKCVIPQKLMEAKQDPGQEDRHHHHQQADMNTAMTLEEDEERNKIGEEKDMKLLLEESEVPRCKSEAAPTSPGTRTSTPERPAPTACPAQPSSTATVKTHAAHGSSPEGTGMRPVTTLTTMPSPSLMSTPSPTK
jgi:hypothetical protein